jgi:hypothetical protein
MIWDAWKIVGRSMGLARVDATDSKPPSWLVITYLAPATGVPTAPAGSPPQVSADPDRACRLRRAPTGGDQPSGQPLCTSCLGTQLA